MNNHHIYQVHNKALIAAPLIPILLFLVGKIFFNTEGDAAGGFKTNLILYLNATATFVVLIYVALRRRNPLTIRIDGIYFITLLYYIFCLFSVVYAETPILTIYGSVLGIGYYIVSIFIGDTICKEKKTLAEKYLLYRNYLLLFSFSSIIINVAFWTLYFQEKSILNGIPSDFVAALILFVFYADVELYPSTKNHIKFYFALILVSFLNSFSSYLSFMIGLLVYLLINKRFILFFLLIVVTYVFGVLAYNILEESIGMTTYLNKPAEAYLTGSGRFDLYEIASGIFFNEFSIMQKIAGVGFMSERYLFEWRDLSWITDPHNSIILNILGLGGLGFVFYLVFAIYPFFFINRFNTKYTKLWLFFHLMSITYGFTSSYYLGRPSFLLIFSLVFYHVLKNSYKNGSILNS